MLSKIAAIAQSKVAVAALGVVLVGGGGGAVAVAATTGHLSTLGINLNSEKSPNAQASETPDSHAHTVGVEGLLVSCSATTAPATIVVKDGKGVSWTFNVSATTKYNGDTETASHAAGGSSTDGAGASSAKSDNSTHAGGSSTDGAGASSAKGDNSTNAGDNSTHAAPTLAEVCAFAGSRDVQVQATPNGSAHDAWKVTVEGPGSIKGDSSEGGASTEGNSTRGSDSSEGGSSTMGGASTKSSDGGASTVGDH
ncbi:MAG TPA: hypothetical protein VFN78_02995 [Ktedonobacterales bacterium]|nr:hypothetical protein [Ktedonobacterales bacterium]